MQDIHIIAPSMDAITPHFREGRWHYWTPPAGVPVYAVCEPNNRGARSRLSLDSALHVLPAASNPAPLPATLASALPASVGALPTDTARSLLARLHAAGVGIFDPEV